MTEYAVRFLVGGIAVSAFAMLGDILRPKRERRIFNSFMMLAVEANGVIALRFMKLTRGGRKARREAELMVKR
jgi:hypothetical protein